MVRVGVVTTLHLLRDLTVLDQHPPVREHFIIIQSINSQKIIQSIN